MRTVRLARLLDSGRPLTYGIVQAGPHTPGGTPYIRPTDMTDSRGVADFDRLLRTTPEIAREYRRAAVAPGDVVLSIGPSYGKVMIVPDSLSGANLTQGTARLAPGPGVDGRWLYWALQSDSVRQQWQALVAGGTFRALNLGPLAQTEIAWPELPQQRHIADFLDDQVARLDAARLDVEALSRVAKAQRESGLAEAYVDVPSPDLLEGRVATPVVSMRALTLRMIAGGTPATGEPSYWDDDGLPWIAIGDMVDGGVTTMTQKRVSRAGLAAILIT